MILDAFLLVQDYTTTDGLLPGIVVIIEVSSKILRLLSLSLDIQSHLHNEFSFVLLLYQEPVFVV